MPFRFFKAVIAGAFICALASPLSAEPWLENCASIVDIRVDAGRVKANGNPWDGPLSTAGFVPEQAPDIQFCTDRCSPPCEDAFACDITIYDPGDTVFIYDKDLLVPDPIGWCKFTQTWACTAQPGSRVRLTVLRKSTCEKSLEDHLRQAQQSGCDAQVAIWSRAALFRAADAIVVRRLSTKLRRSWSILGPTLGKAVKRSVGPEPESGADLLALRLAAKPQWLPEDYLAFALLVDAARGTPEATEGLYPFMDQEVITACKQLSD